MAQSPLTLTLSPEGERGYVRPSALNTSTAERGQVGLSVPALRGLTAVLLSIPSPPKGRGNTFARRP